MTESREKSSKLSSDSLEATNPIHEGFTPITSSNPKFLPKALAPNTITLWRVVSTYEVWRDTNIQSITLPQEVKSIKKEKECILYLG